MRSRLMPKVSIGMPVYNGGKFLAIAINSLLSQSEKDFELIISDNHSDDHTFDICKNFAKKDTRIKIFRQEENVGAEGNFEFVLNKASTDNFMWAAHDDRWARNFLSDALILLENKNLEYVFPTFALESMNFGISKKINKEHFDFIGLEDEKLRILNFISLHHNSHKCNLVYSLFRREFIQTALQKQNIANDGALAAIIVALGRGDTLNSVSFYKRYKYFWPGFLSKLYFYRYGNKCQAFQKAKIETVDLLEKHFPDLSDQIKIIYDEYHPFSHNKNYQICDITKL